MFFGQLNNNFDVESPHSRSFILTTGRMRCTLLSSPTHACDYMRCANNVNLISRVSKKILCDIIEYVYCA